MESNHYTYNYLTSFNRMDAYLDASNDLFEEVDEIPSRDKLTYSNGFYIKHCTAMFVDIRGSSDLPNKYKRPRLAKIYRSYIAEVVAIINGNPNCAEINIVGDAVYGIFNTPYQADINAVFDSAAMVNSAVKTLNWKLKKRDIEPISIGVGIDYGRLLMVQAGYSGSGLNEVVWMGHAVNSASNLCHHGCETIWDRTVMISSVIHNNLKDEYKALTAYNQSRSCYHAEIINIAMDGWYALNCY